jgi:hypothetical protein
MHKLKILCLVPIIQHGEKIKAKNNVWYGDFIAFL